VSTVPRGAQDKRSQRDNVINNGICGRLLLGFLAMFFHSDVLNMLSKSKGSVQPHEEERTTAIMIIINNIITVM
jgi:hypothetical protein